MFIGFRRGRYGMLYRGLFGRSIKVVEELRENEDLWVRVFIGDWGEVYK